MVVGWEKAVGHLLVGQRERDRRKNESKKREPK
jgi:hypothetical protein